MRHPRIFAVPLCPYCGTESQLVKGGDVYPHTRRPELLQKPFYLCRPCDAWVGCHPGTEEPLGSLANPALRRWRNRAHAAVDPLWRGGPMTRTEAYAWLATRLGISCRDCHIAMFDEAQCKRAEELARAYFTPRGATA